MQYIESTRMPTLPCMITKRHNCNEEPLGLLSVSLTCKWALSFGTSYLTIGGDFLRVPAYSWRKALPSLRKLFCAVPRQQENCIIERSTSKFTNIYSFSAVDPDWLSQKKKLRTLDHGGTGLHRNLRLHSLKFFARHLHNSDCPFIVDLVHEGVVGLDDLDVSAYVVGQAGRLWSGCMTAAMPLAPADHSSPWELVGLSPK